MLKSLYFLISLLFYEKVLPVSNSSLYNLSV